MIWAMADSAFATPDDRDALVVFDSLMNSLTTGALANRNCGSVPGCAIFSTYGSPDVQGFGFPGGGTYPNTAYCFQQLSYPTNMGL